MNHENWLSYIEEGDAVVLNFADCIRVGRVMRSPWIHDCDIVRVLVINKKDSTGIITDSREYLFSKTNGLNVNQEFFVTPVNKEFIEKYLHDPCLPVFDKSLAITHMLVACKTFSQLLNLAQNYSLCKDYERQS